MQSTRFLWDYQPSQDHRSSSTTEQIAASSPPQKGLPSTLEAAPGVVQLVQTRRLSPIKNSLATTRDTHLLTQKTYSPSYGSMSNLHKQQKVHNHPPVNNHLNSLKFSTSPSRSQTSNYHQLHPHQPMHQLKSLWHHSPKKTLISASLSPSQHTNPNSQLPTDPFVSTSPLLNLSVGRQRTSDASSNVSSPTSSPPTTPDSAMKQRSPSL